MYKKLVEVVNNTKKHKADPDHTGYRKDAIERIVAYLSYDLTPSKFIVLIDKANIKPFYKYVKSLKHDNVGLAPPKTGADLVRDSEQKAELLLEELAVLLPRKILSPFHG